MKILSGNLKNRNIKTKLIDRKYTRPVRAIVRKSLFSSIETVYNKSILDLFCGSGILGIEALSRGAKKVFFIDNNKLVIKQLKENIRSLGIEDKCEIFNVDYRFGLKALKKRNMEFDIIFSDPPYDRLEKFDISNYIIINKVLKKDGIIVQMQHSKRHYDYEDLKIVYERKMGKTKYIILKME